MALRTSFAAALQFLRAHRQASQRDISSLIDQSYISRLESASRAVTLETTQDLATTLNLDPLSLLTVVYAIDQGLSPQTVLNNLQADLASAKLLDASLPSHPVEVAHPVVSRAAALRAQIVELSATLTSAEIARELGVTRQTVNKHLRESRSDS